MAGVFDPHPRLLVVTDRFLLFWFDVSGIAIGVLLQLGSGIG